MRVRTTHGTGCTPPVGGLEDVRKFRPANSGLWLGATGALILLGDAPSKAIPFNRDDVRVMDEAVDEGDCGAGVGEDRGPVAEMEIGGQDEAALLMAAANDLGRDSRPGAGPRASTRAAP